MNCPKTASSISSLVESMTSQSPQMRSGRRAATSTLMVADKMGAEQHPLRWDQSKMCSAKSALRGSRHAESSTTSDPSSGPGFSATANALVYSSKQQAAAPRSFPLHASATSLPQQEACTRTRASQAARGNSSPPAKARKRRSTRNAMDTSIGLCRVAHSRSKMSASWGVPPSTFSRSSSMSQVRGRAALSAHAMAASVAQRVAATRNPGGTTVAVSPAGVAARSGDLPRTMSAVLRWPSVAARFLHARKPCAADTSVSKSAGAPSSSRRCIAFEERSSSLRSAKATNKTFSASGRKSQDAWS
mmetsp:Transcript_56270/g.156742  ORF Transcript_56270/g.156742 Transcript_56270/m.156742 type:complete len:303 (-) Transcript_56270:687-1595(-)